jgi:hypothetical protein
MTGQISKPSGTSKYQIELEGFEQDVTWKSFKALVLDPENGGALREACWTQLRVGDAFERFFDTPQSDDA